MTVSVTFKDVNLFKNQGTTFQPIRIAPAKNKTFFKITVVRFTSPPAKLIKNAKAIITTTSSITAAPTLHLNFQQS